MFSQPSTSLLPEAASDGLQCGDESAEQTQCASITAGLCVLLIPGTESHQWDGSAGEEDGDQQERPPPPHVRQRTDQRGRHERQQTLESPQYIFMLTGCQVQTCISFCRAGVVGQIQLSGFVNVHKYKCNDVRKILPSHPE